MITEIMTLKDVVAYQNASVVSRTLVDKDEGTVTAFAFDENQGLSEHTAPYDAMVIVINGKVDVRISGDDFHLEGGQMIIMPANKPHALKAVTKFKMLLIMIRAK
jgi:quercetin dioxygenase-like cupin family protein